MNRIVYAVLFFYGWLFLATELSAQQAGDELFSFLRLPTSARATAMGGQQMAIADGDAQWLGENPAWRTTDMAGKLRVSSLFFPAGIHLMQAGYAHQFGESGPVGSIDLQWLGYGQFTGTDQFANLTGDFRGDDGAVSAGLTWQRGAWSFGGSLKGIVGSFDRYAATAVALDGGIGWSGDEGRRSFALVVENAGTIIKDYNNAESEARLPFDVQFGFSQRLKYVPFRFSVNANNLHRWNLRYDDPNAVESTVFFDDDEPGNDNNFTDEFFRHLIFSGELYLGKALSIQAAYNHRRRRELSIAGAPGPTGVSFGLGVQTRRFRFHYGQAVLSRAGSSRQLSVIVDVNGWKNSRSSATGQNPDL